MIVMSDDHKQKMCHQTVCYT